MYINEILNRFELELANKRHHVTTFRILSPILFKHSLSNGVLRWKDCQML